MDGEHLARIVSDSVEREITLFINVRTAFHEFQRGNSVCLSHGFARLGYVGNIRQQRTYLYKAGTRPL
jgi:hypothetical protein